MSDYTELIKKLNELHESPLNWVASDSIKATIKDAVTALKQAQKSSVVMEGMIQMLEGS